MIHEKDRIRKHISFLPLSKFSILFFISYFNISSSYYTNAHFHLATKLKNGNFMVFTCEGIYNLDPYFNLYNITNGLSYDNFHENLAHFSEEDGGYFLYISDNDHHLFSSYGNILESYSFSFSKYYYQYSVVPYNHTHNNYYYYLIFIDSNCLYFKLFSFNPTTNKILYNNSLKYSSIDSISNFISCELMNKLNQKVITCFYVISSNNSNYFLNCTTFEIENFFSITNYENQKTKTSNITIFYNIKSAIDTINGRQKSLACSMIRKNSVDALFYAGYDINNNNLKEGIINEFTNYNCILMTTSGSNYFSLSFFKETEEFVVSILTKCYINNEQYFYYFLYTFDCNFNYKFFGTIRSLTLGDSCCSYNTFQTQSIYLHSILFSSLTQKYCFIGNVDSSNTMIMFILNKDVKIYNPIELNSNYSIHNIICEDYFNYKKISCSTNNLDFQKLLSNTSMNYLEKCTTDLIYIRGNSPCSIDNYKTFNFSLKYPHELIDENRCVTIYEKLENILNFKNNDNNNDIKNNQEEVIKKIKEIFSSGGINTQLDKIVNGDEDIVISNGETLIQITSTDNQNNNKNHNISSIKLGECEDILKDKYNINKNSSLLILKVDLFIEFSKIPIIQYEVYHPVNKSKLDLNFCDNSKIEINVPVLIDENNLYKYEPNSDYYNDRCNTSTLQNNIDIPLIYRREEFVKKKYVFM